MAYVLSEVSNLRLTQSICVKQALERLDSFTLFVNAARHFVSSADLSTTRHHWIQQGVTADA